MSSEKIYGEDPSKLKRTCRLKGRPVDKIYWLIRKGTQNVTVLEVGTVGKGESVGITSVYDERIAPRQVRRSPAAEPKSYPADKLPHRVCFVEGRHPEERYHLLRKGVDQSKVLKVGEGGVGEWIPTSHVKDEHLVPTPNRSRVLEKRPVRICKLDGREGIFLLIRKTDKGARVFGPLAGEYYGETVSPETIKDEETINDVKGEEPSSETGTVDRSLTDVSQDSTAESLPSSGEGDFDESDFDEMETEEEFEEDDEPEPAMAATPAMSAPAVAPQPAPVATAPQAQPSAPQAPAQPRPAQPTAPQAPAQPPRPPAPQAPAQPRPQQPGQPVSAAPQQRPVMPNGGPGQVRPQQLPPRPNVGTVPVAPRPTGVS